MIDHARQATDAQRRRVVWTRALSKPGVGKHLRLIPLLAPTLIWTHKSLFICSVVFRVPDCVGPCRVSMPSDRNLRKDSITHQAHVALDSGSTPSAVVRVTSIASRTLLSLVVSCVQW